MKVRIATRGDCEDIAELDKKWKKEGISPGFTPMTRKELVEAVSRHEIIAIGEEKGKIIGYALGVMHKAEKKSFYINKNERYVELDSLYVSKRSRNEGVGRELVRTLVKEAKKRKITKILVAADNTNMKRLVEFYGKMGFAVLFTRLKLEVK